MKTLIAESYSYGFTFIRTGVGLENLHFENHCADGQSRVKALVSGTLI